MIQDEQKLLREVAQLCVLNKQAIDALETKFLELASLINETTQAQLKRNKLIINAFKEYEKITTATANSVVELYETVETLQYNNKLK